MRRSTHWRRLATFAIVLDSGPCHVDELEAATRIRLKTLYSDLAYLEKAGLVIRKRGQDALGRPGRMLYRAVPAGERAVHAMVREIEDLAAKPGDLK